MSLSSFKITSGDIAQKGVVAAPDRLTGNAQQNKMVFDRLIRELVAELYNSLIDELSGANGAGDIGLTEIEGVTGSDIQTAMGSVKAILDSKESSADITAALALKSDKSVTDLHIKSVGFDAQTGAFTFTQENGSFTTIDTALEKIATNWEYDAATQSLVLTLIDGTRQTVPLSAFITETEFTDSDSITFSVSNHVVSATVKAGGITDSMLSSALAQQLQSYVANAAASATSAQQSANAAEGYKNNAASSASAAANSASDAQAAAESAAADAASEAVQDVSALMQGYVTSASGSASAAANSETNAANSASASASSSSAAATSAQNAANSASAAAASETDAANSASNAAASKTFVDQRIQGGLDRGLLIVKSLTATLSANGWSNTVPYTQTITLPEGSMTADQSGSIHLAEGATAEQVEAESNAVLMPTAQAADSVTVTAYGLKPSIDLPVELHLTFNDETLLDEFYAQLLGLDSALRFSSPAPFTLAIENQAKNWDGVLEYTDGRSDWAEWDGTTTLSSGEKKRLYLRGTGNTVITGSSAYKYGFILGGTSIVCDGNIETLLDYATVAAGSHPTMGYACYARLFDGCTGLISAPELPATTLATLCYQYMFYGCTGLISAPELPATTLATLCYQYMFGGCTSLISAPELPATTLANACYEFMFHFCTGLKFSETQDSTYAYPYRIPTSGTGTDATSALTAMFSGTGGTFVGTPTINTTYYTDHKPVGA